MVSTIWSIRGRGKLFFGKTSLRSVKLTHTRHLPLFFRTTTTLANHFGYYTSWMNPTSSNRFTSSTMILCRSSWNFRNFCLTGCHSLFTFKWWQATKEWIPFTSECFHAKTSAFCLSSWVNFLSLYYFLHEETVAIYLEGESTEFWKNEILFFRRIAHILFLWGNRL